MMRFSNRIRAVRMKLTGSGLVARACLLRGGLMAVALVTYLLMLMIGSAGCSPEESQGAAGANSLAVARGKPVASSSLASSSRTLTETPTASPADDELSAIRPVRALLGDRLERVRIRSADGLIVTSFAEDGGGLSAGAGIQTEITKTDWIVLPGDQPGRLENGGLSITGRRVVLASRSGQPVEICLPNKQSWRLPRAYEGRLVLFRPDQRGMRLINEVEVEPYVASVTAREAGSRFHREAYRAQAIMARSYVLFEMLQRRGKAYDVKATEASQVYQGVQRDGAGRKGREAAAYTRGIVCTYHDGIRSRLFPTYYSAACGGVTQSAEIFGPQSQHAPLCGGVECDYCEIAPARTYHWGPLELTKSEIFRRFGKRYPSAAQKLGGLSGIDISRSGPGGRPVEFMLIGTSGQRHAILAERFRQAIGPRAMRSTMFHMRDAGSSIVFEDGRGYGHGLGACQWGMEGLARQGYLAAEILRFYYPGSTLSRAY